ncbi:MAG TPA: alginate lyase family protein, partial [Armatimonadota bacterium]|nr:alginate lyase family protein [Armatimonadota bacterium]
MTAITDPSTCAWVCAHHGQRVRQLFAALNLELPALAAVRAAVAAEDWERAGAALLDYYRAGDSGQWLRHDPVPPGEGTDPDAERMARACFPVPGGEVQLPRLPSGNFDWGHVPPVVGGIEWSCGVNRHDYMADLLRAFYATGNRAYVRALTEQVHDWCATVAEPDPIDRHDGSSPWGTILEVGHRAKAWPAVFYGLQPEAAFTPAARLLLLCRALDHAQFLRRHHAGGSNWIITEMCGLLSIACAFPELRDAGEWRDLALRLTQEELAGQLYPDGVQKELASNYQLAVLWHMDFFVATVRGAGMPADPALSALLEAMWNYLAYALSPNGYAPHNSDSDRPLSDASQAIKPLLARGPILAAADAYDRPDWRYIATNGEEGARPPRSPSVLFPWAGQLIMRSGWEAEAQWGFFDLGPWGILHQHNDMLHLSVTAGGRDLLVDSGRYTYQHYMGEAGTWRSYFIGSAAHNVICVDGLEQTNGPALAARPVEAVITPAYDYAQGTYAGGFTDVATAAARHKAYLYRWELPRDAVREDITHTRGVLYLRGVGWVVVDRVTLMQPR